MKFTPKTEDELRAEAEKRGAWSPGVYDAEIISATEKVSAAGNEMIELLLNVYHPDDGAQRQVKDWLVSVPGGAFKVRHCCESAGLSADYDAGSLDAWKLESKPVKVKLKVETFQTDDGPRQTNKVADYVASAVPAAPRAPARQPAPASAAPARRDFDDDIPF